MVESPISQVVEKLLIAENTLRKNNNNDETVLINDETVLINDENVLINDENVLINIFLFS